MRSVNLPLPRLLGLPAVVLLACAAAWPQAAPVAPRIVDRVDENALVTLRGNTHPLAQAQFDRGPAPPDLPMARMLLVLKRSDAQEAALEKLLDDQQDLSSSSYHQWLTPDQFGQQFGPSTQDVQAIAAWLRSHGFQVAVMSRGLTVIEFSGTAAQVQQAFHTEIHKFTVDGEDHWANASDPQIPAALAPVITGINSLHNFPKQPMYRLVGKSLGSGAGAEGFDFTATLSMCGGADNCYFVGPYDFGAIYNLFPLWSPVPLAVPIDGTGQGIGILNESNINIQDVRDFRNMFGLPANDPQVILNGADPGLVQGVESEADLDVEWSGAVAPGATIKLVVTAPTNSTDGVDLSAVYAVENNVAPVISESFGECELFLGNAGNSFQNAIRQQAAAQGITYINSSGDEGSARCDPSNNNPPDPATHGLAVSGLASSPYGVAVGGTDFLNFGSNYDLNVASPYWNPTNDQAHQASAKGYVPETSWNDTCTNNVFVFFKVGSNPEASCNNSQLSNAVFTVAGGGGKSSCTNSDGSTPSSCSGGYPKPSWQAAPGVLTDAVRDIPDVSLFAGNGFMDSAYIICEADRLPLPQPCSLSSPLNTFVAIGGTSASAPSFAGIVALVNQFTNSLGQGQANYVLYKMAASSLQTSHSCGATSNASSSCIFYDVISGTNAVPCAKGSPDCSPAGSDQYGVLPGYNAGAGYDLTTGLGSVNAGNLVHNWIQPANSSSTTLSLNSGKAVSITHGQSVNVSILVTPSAATGVVSLDGTPIGAGSVSMASFPLQNGAASGTTTTLAGGTSYAVKAHYSGDGTYKPSDSAPVTVTVAPEASKTIITVPTFDPNTGSEIGNTPSSVVYGSPLTVRVDVGNSQASQTFPEHLVCALLACATGSITLTDSFNGGPPSPVSPGGSLALNSGGFVEEAAVPALSAGTHQLTASYGGDNSYQPSTGAYTLAVTPAATSIGQTFTVISPVVGTPFFASVTGYSQATNGVAPTGTVTFYDGQTQIGSSGPITGSPGSRPQFFASATLTVVSGGTRTITAQYSGDANYAASTTSTTVTAFYPATASISVSPGTVNYGASVTITGIIDTLMPATNAPLKPTGTVLVNANLGGNTISAVTTTTTADASGNWQIQVSATAIPSGTEEFNLFYSGDSNYASVTGYSNLITVSIPDFSLGPAAGITVVPVAGQAGNAQVTVTPLSQTPSPVTLLVQPPISMSGYTIAITPQPVNLNGAPVTATISLTPTMTAPTSSTQSQVHHAALIGRGRSVYWPLSAATGLAALFLMAIPRPRRKYRGLASLTMFCVALFVLGCGGGSSFGGGGGGGGGNGGGGNGGGGNGPQPTTITLSTSSPKAGQYTQLPITATVTSASGDSITGNVTFYNFGVPFGSGYSIINGQYTFQGNVGELGIFQVTASYSGDSNHLPSTTSSPLIQMVTGSVAVTITGNTGVDLHSVPATIGLQ